MWNKEKVSKKIPIFNYIAPEEKKAGHILLCERHNLPHWFVTMILICIYETLFFCLQLGHTNLFITDDALCYELLIQNARFLPLLSLWKRGW